MALSLLPKRLSSKQKSNLDSYLKNNLTPREEIGLNLAVFGKLSKKEKFAYKGKKLKRIKRF